MSHSHTDTTTPQTTSGDSPVQVTQVQEAEEDEFDSYFLPNAVLIKMLEEVEDELGLNDTNDDESPPASPPPSLLTQLVEEDNHATSSSEEESADRKRLISHMLQMRANLEHYLTQKLLAAREPQQRMLFQKIRQFASLKTHPRQVSIVEYTNAMHTIRDYGNRAAHNQASMPNREECLAAVAKFSALKADYERHCRSR